MPFFPNRTRSEITCRRTALFRSLKPRIEWTPEKDRILLEKRDEGLSWTEIQKSIPEAHYINLKDRMERLRGKHRYGRWDAEERDRCFKAYEALGPRWKEVAKAVGARSPRQCSDMIRIGARTAPDNMLTKDGVGGVPKRRLTYRAWTAQEYAQLMRLTKQYGPGRWAQIAEQLESLHPPYSCRHRWFAGPPKSFYTWNSEDEEALALAVQRHGTSDWLRVGKEVGFYSEDCRMLWEKVRFTTPDDQVNQTDTPGHPVSSTKKGKAQASLNTPNSAMTARLWKAWSEDALKKGTSRGKGKTKRKGTVDENATTSSSPKG
ncbi:MAG: hypothetical protein DHS80DRAFT_23264 [Piptocephalis tieghemiana]|nr:MAG: hypothetical protein DHS80DRAFT_23264 [Piptocephalis tieghemiana]